MSILDCFSCKGIGTNRVQKGYFSEVIECKLCSGCGKNIKPQKFVFTIFDIIFSNKEK